MHPKSAPRRNEAASSRVVLLVREFLQVMDGGCARAHLPATTGTGTLAEVITSCFQHWQRWNRQSKHIRWRESRLITIWTLECIRSCCGVTWDERKYMSPIFRVSTALELSQACRDGQSSNLSQDVLEMSMCKIRGLVHRKTS